jgi:hypothetical protein
MKYLASILIGYLAISQIANAENITTPNAETKRWLECMQTKKGEPFCGQAPKNLLTALATDSDFSVKIAVTINEQDNIIGKVEYSNHSPQYDFQLVSFVVAGGDVYVEPYLFKLIDRKIVSRGVHKIRCVSINDMYGAGTILVGTVDFSDPSDPKIFLQREGGDGHAFMKNITAKGKAVHDKYFKNVWIGN